MQNPAARYALGTRSAIGINQKWRRDSESVLADVFLATDKRDNLDAIFARAAERNTVVLSLRARVNENERRMEKVTATDCWIGTWRGSEVHLGGKKLDLSEWKLLNFVCV